MEARATDRTLPRGRIALISVGRWLCIIGIVAFRSAGVAAPGRGCV